jgi:hypothetical protein
MKVNNYLIVEEGIFCYGSNECGRSFSGAAKTAVEKYEAQLGISFGLTGQAFAIPTKDSNLKPLYSKYVKNYVDEFLKIASKKVYPDSLDESLWYYEKRFMCTKIGCGFAGFTNEQMAPLFKNATSNIEFDSAWKPWLGDKAFDGEPRKYWGSYED